MEIKCVSRFRNDNFDLVPGQLLSLSDEEGQLLLRCSRDSFEWLDKPEPVDDSPPPSNPDPVTAMSTETATGIVAPDRRARGGRKRTTKRTKK